MVSLNTMLKVKVIFSFFCMSLAAATTTYWTKSLDDLQFRSPAGKEGDVNLYACRTKVNEDLIVGKVWNLNGSPTSNTAYKGKHHGSGDFEVLKADQDSTSWIPYDGSVGINNIVGGQLNRSVIYVCRAFAANWLVPGYFVPQTKTCYVEIRTVPDMHPYHEVTEDFEVLAVNKFGLLKGNPTCLYY